MTHHTPEPWEIDDEYVQQDGGGDIAICHVLSIDENIEGHWGRGKITEANARRIVACVNACRGLPTDELEQKGIVAAVGNQMLDMDRKLHLAQTDSVTWEDRATKEASRAADLQAQVDELLAALVNAKESLECCYDVTDWPCNGSTDQDKAIAIAAAAINKTTGEPK